jgi:hypothetical protein
MTSRSETLEGLLARRPAPVGTAKQRKCVMRERRPESAEGPVLIAIDHLFVGGQDDGCAQTMYDALGALDAAWPEAIAPIAASDLALLVACARERAQSGEAAGRERDALQGAARRVGHVLERAPHRRTESRRVAGRFVPGSLDGTGIDPGQDGGTVFTLGADVR